MSTLQCQFVPGECPLSFLPAPVRRNAPGPRRTGRARRLRELPPGAPRQWPILSPSENTWSQKTSKMDALEGGKKEDAFILHLFLNTVLGMNFKREI